MKYRFRHIHQDLKPNEIAKNIYVSRVMKYQKFNYFFTTLKYKWAHDHEVRVLLNPRLLSIGFQ